MSTNRSTDVLNRLLVLHSRSLPLYLLDAAPWSQPSDEAALSVIRDIAHDRAFSGPDVSAVRVICTAETRNRAHITALHRALRQRGFPLE